jgi:hypothetical protein
MRIPIAPLVTVVHVPPLNRSLHPCDKAQIEIATVNLLAQPASNPLLRNLACSQAFAHHGSLGLLSCMGPPDIALLFQDGVSSVT